MSEPVATALGYKTSKQQDSKVFERLNRGIVLDLIVLLVNLVLMRLVTRIAFMLVAQSETNATAKLGIGAYFGLLLCLQPLGPLLKRWSFHHSETAEKVGTQTTGCWFFWFLPVYLVMMLGVAGAAATLTTEAFFEPGSPAAQLALLLLAAGFVYAAVSAVLIYRYFVQPRKQPRWRWLMTPQADIWGDVCMFLNVILLQILWNCLTAATTFWSLLTSTPLGKPGSLTDILGRFIVIGALAMLVYLPPRIFYLVQDQQKKLTWLTMLLANLPLIIRAVVASHH